MQITIHAVNKKFLRTIVINQFLVKNTVYPLNFTVFRNKKACQYAYFATFHLYSEGCRLYSEGCRLYSEGCRLYSESCRLYSDTLRLVQ